MGGLSVRKSQVVVARRAYPSGQLTVDHSAMTLTISFKARTAGLPSGSRGCEQATVHPRSLIIECQWIPRSGGPLQPVLPPSTFVNVIRGVGTRSQLCESDRCNGGLIGK